MSTVIYPPAGIWNAARSQFSCQNALVELNAATVDFAGQMEELLSVLDASDEMARNLPDPVLRRQLQEQFRKDRLALHAALSSMLGQLRGLTLLAPPAVPDAAQGR